MTKPVGKGMLQSGKNTLDTPCPQVNRAVPYFKMYEDGMDDGKSMNQHMFDVLDSLSQQFLDTYSKNTEIEGLEKVPDGMVEIGKASKENLMYRI